LWGAAVIWKFIYDYRGEGQEQIGVLNAICVALGGSIVSPAALAGSRSRSGTTSS
jgi:hypothetical protein